MTMPHVGLCGWPFMAHNFQGNESMIILICSTFALLGNIAKIKTFNFDNIAEH